MVVTRGIMVLLLESRHDEVDCGPRWPARAQESGGRSTTRRGARVAMMMPPLLALKSDAARQKVAEGDVCVRGSPCCMSPLAGCDNRSVRSALLAENPFLQAPADVVNRGSERLRFCEELLLWCDCESYQRPPVTDEPSVRMRARSPKC